MTIHNCLIIGAGLAGLMAGQALKQQGHSPLILEQASQAGGRLATQTIGQAVFDTGAQFFTVRTQQFGAWVEKWLADGLVREWSRGFADWQGRYVVDGYPRYCGTRGMNGIPQALARNLDVKLAVTVQKVVPAGNLYHVITPNQTYQTRSLILTPPLPQTCQLLTEFPLPVQLTQHNYHACLALMVILDGLSAVPMPGALRPGQPISWLADNQQKGISPVPALTIHADPAFSQANWSTPAQVVTEQLLEACQPWLGANVIETKLQRWRFSRPVDVFDEACWVMPGRANIILAGDIFAGPRVEGAALSGLSAAQHLLTLSRSQ